MLLLEKKIKDIILDNPGMAEILERHRLDYCCNGNKTLAEAIATRHLSAEAIEKELLEFINSDSCIGDDNYDMLSMNELIDHIMTTHHDYLNRVLPVISEHTRKISRVHGENHHELLDVAYQFELLKNDLVSHMAKEEQILFPYIRHLENATESDSQTPLPPFGTVENPIAMMEDEHRAVGEILSKINDLTNSFAPPPEACTTYRLTFLELQDLEENLHQHIHLENNLLFPKSIELEKNKLYERS